MGENLLREALCSSSLLTIGTMTRSAPSLIAVSITITALISSATTGRAAEVRTWTSAAGSHKTEAEFVELTDDGTVVLKTKAGKTIQVPLSKLSEADQTFARSQ